MAAVIWIAIHYGIHNDFLATQLNVNHTLAQEYLRIPVTIVTRQNDPRGFRLMPNEAVVVIVGEESALRQARTKDIKVFVDLTGFNAYSPALQELQAEVPRDINVLEISPRFVNIQLASK
jgi:hypothetical protein